MTMLLLSVLCIAVASAASSSVFLTDGKNRHQIIPFYKAPNDIEIETSNGMRLDCVLSILDLPQGSVDLVDISRAKSIDHLLILPRSIYGEHQFWKDLRRGDVPSIILLLLLDDDRYNAFEAGFLSGAIKLHQLFKVEHRHLSTSDHFPDRRLLKTLKAYLQDGKSTSFGYPSFLAWTTSDHFIDWARVFFEDQVWHLTDNQITNNAELRRTVIRDILYKFSTRNFRVADDFVGLMECFVFSHENLLFYERFEKCVNELGRCGDHSGLTQFHTKIVVHRNELLFRQAFAGKKTATSDEHAFVSSILNVYQATVADVHGHLEDKIIQYGKFFTPTLWKILGTELQLGLEHSQVGYPILALLCYFLGHVELLPPLIQAHPDLISLPRSQSCELRSNFDPKDFGYLHIRLLGDALDLATAFDPEICITNRIFALRSISNERVCNLSALSYLLIKNEPLPKCKCCFEQGFAQIYDDFMLEPFKKRLYPHLCRIPRNSLVHLVAAMGFDVLNFLDSDTCVWLLTEILERSRTIDFSLDFVHNLERYFPLIAREKSADWAVWLLKRSIVQHEVILSHIVAAMIRCFDLTASLFNLLLQHSANNTGAFVQLFRKIWGAGVAFDCNAEAARMLRQIRPGLARWLYARFDVQKKQDGCTLIKKSQVY